MEKTRYFTAAKPITPEKRYHYQEKENNCGEEIDLTWGEEQISLFGRRQEHSPIMKQTDAKLSQPEAWRIFLGQRGKRQNMITIKQIPPPRIQ